MLGLLVPQLADQVVGELDRDRPLQGRVARTRRQPPGSSQQYCSLVEPGRQPARPGDNEEHVGVGVDHLGGKLVEQGAKFQGVHRLDHLGRRGGEHCRGLAGVARGQQQLERPLQFAPPAVLLRRLAHGLGADGRKRGQVVPHRPGQVPPRAPGGRVGDTGAQAAPEEPLFPDGQVDQPGVKQGQAGDLGQPPARGWAEGDDGLVQDGGYRLGGVPRPDRRLGHVPEGLAGAGGPRCGQDGGRRPASGGPVQDFGRLRADLQLEAAAA